jgi:phage-related protein
MKKIVAFKSYYKDFMASMSREEQLKIRRVLALFETQDLIPHHYIKYVGNAIFELRITLPTREVRIFFIYDGDTMVVLFNCFIKKTQKTPKKEIEKAIKLKREYEESK